jgi:hypothetical protein
MPTQIIDTSLHLPAFPPAYTGPGNLIGNPVQSGDDTSGVFGYFTSAGNAVQINCGFAPNEVEVTDVTGVLVWKWSRGMPATNSVKTATGATTIDTTSGITVTTDLAGNGYVTLSAALVGTGKVINYRIQG